MLLDFIMTQTNFLLVAIMFGPIALVISFIALWLSLKNRKEQILPHALSKKLGVITIVLEARSYLSDIAILCVQQMQHMDSLASADLSQNKEKVQRAFETALEKMELCDQLCIHIRAVSPEVFQESPSFALRAEEMLIEASTERDKQRENLFYK